MFYAGKKVEGIVRVFRELWKKYKRYREHVQWTEISVCSWELLPPRYYYLHSEEETEKMEWQALDELWDQIDSL